MNIGNMSRRQQLQQEMIIKNNRDQPFNLHRMTRAELILRGNTKVSSKKEDTSPVNRTPNATLKHSKNLNVKDQQDTK